MITSFPNYADIFTKLPVDIESRTGITTRYDIDNQDILSDTPTNLLEYAGTTEIVAHQNGVVKSQTIAFKLTVQATAANSDNIAEIAKAEAMNSTVFPYAKDLKTAEMPMYELTDITGYNVWYHCLWNPNNPEMEESEYKRKWDLIVKITQKR